MSLKRSVFFIALAAVLLMVFCGLTLTAQTVNPGSAVKNLRIIATGEILEDWNWTQFDSCNARIKSVADSLSVEYPNYGPADILVGNYEGFIDDGQLVGGLNDYFGYGNVFHSGRSYVIDSLMSKLGVNMICPVNNHTFDGMDIDDKTVAWGRQGVEQTYNCLEARDILFAGIGATRNEVKTPRSVTIRDAVTGDSATVGMICAGDNSNETPSYVTGSACGMWHSLNDDDASLMQTSHVGIDVVTTGRGNRRVSIGYWPSKEVFDSIAYRTGNQ